ncbi:hypothetical protein D7Y13_34140, partial [Corallococcus praedator]
MHLELPRLSASRAAFLASLAISALSACGGDPKPPPIPDPPVVTLTITEANAAPKVKIRLLVSGCDPVAQTEIYDREVFLKTVPYTSGSMDFELAANELKYTSGLAATLALHAKVTCSDGRSNVSQPQAATFLPVTKVVKDPDPNGQVVTDFFVAEGNGTGVNFIGCGNPTTGVGTLFRVDANGALQQSVAMGVPCNASTVYTDLHPTTNKRWVWTPGARAVAVHQNFTISGTSKPTIFLSSLSMMNNGDALIADDDNIVYRLPHDSGIGAPKWTFASQWPLVAPPLQKGSDVLVAFMKQPEVTTSKVLQIVVARLDANGTGDLVPVSERAILNYNGDFGSPPLASFSPDGTVLYLAFPLGNNQSSIQACRVDVTGCEGSGLKWNSPALPVPLQFV